MKRSIVIKLLSAFLAAVMVMSMAVTAFAQENIDDRLVLRPIHEQEEAAEEVPEETKEEIPNEEIPTENSEEPAELAEQSAEQENGGEELSTESTDSYSDFICYLNLLENYAEAYVREHEDEDSVALVINYIRCGVEKYTSGTWTAFCGPENTAFTSYVAEQDAANGTSAARLRNMENFILPNGNEVDFKHMFGAMDMAYHTKNQSTADLGSWAGDICDLVQLTTNAGVTGTVEEMAEEIRTNNDKYFLYDHPSDDVHSFGILDLYGDLDAFYILKKLEENGSISAIMKNYFTANLNDSIRAKFFLENRFGVSKKGEIRESVYSTYYGNEGIRTLEGTYLPNGVNADLRRACCYAFADYLYLTAKDRLDNPYYKVFSSTSSVIAPGVTQEIKMALTNDDKQIVYYIATADITRSDVNIYANYNGNDGSVWKMARVTDQMKSAEAKHTNPDDAENYIPNYSAVISTNADFYNMSNGAPAGALVMEGVEYNGLGNEDFFGILNDGTPIIGGSEEWNANRGNIKEAVGARPRLIKNGKIIVDDTSDYYSQRVTRTCVGITYDGKVVMMVLDGRQEPFSAGGSAIEIAQIMLDAGCVEAVNLDGGGSSTFAAKGEGSNDIAVVNRPSDGYERSVSSSLLVVSTAKPSTEFDHAVISADYDYLTVGTELEIRVAGVTSTGGAIAVPEDAELKVSDESKGNVVNGVFTATAVGNAKVQLVAADGSVLGSKTLHIVEPDELKFTKDNFNIIYGETEELPIEATYSGNVVKINPNDVQFGYLKITLQSIGEIEGGSVNTTKTELVFEYPEAGSISGFEFTANPTSTLRTLTIGAVLKSKLPEFQAIINAEYARVYQEAKANGYSDEEAAIQAQTAAVNRALDSATKITAYLYNNNEASFDFNNASGGSGLLAWKREVPGSAYKSDDNTYYLTDAASSGKVNYTFAVDMSKMPIPEKLTALLYMLPGGDQEGRTAWDFLLQLAERISPLTTVTITVSVPEGFAIDKTNLRLANEYFTLTSAEVENNKLTVVCNFIAQGEPINPANANPLCVLSGIKVVPNENAAWDDDGKIEFSVSGELSYDIYAHFHVLMSLAQQEEYQQKYGLYPYDNRANDLNDYGAHFFDTVADFTDTFGVKKNTKDGWVKEDGAWHYYQGGEVLTGVNKLPSYTDGEEGEYWYDLGETGRCEGKLTGLFEYQGKIYYAINGETKTGWREIERDDGEKDYYYFDPITECAVNGVQIINTIITENGKQYTKDLSYTFEDYLLVRGDWITANTGRRYYWAGQPIARKWWTVDGNKYFFGDHGDALVGFCAVPRGNSGQGADYYLFEEDGTLVVNPGMYKLTSVISHIASGFSIDDIVYFDETGMASFAGLVYGKDGYLYYVNANLKAVKDGKYWVTKTNGIVKTGYQREFDAEGRMIAKNGILPLDGNGVLVYYVNDDVQYDLGLVRMADGRMIYVNADATLKANGTYYLSKTNGILPQGYYPFDSNCILQLNGWFTDEFGKTYYKDGIMHGQGWDAIDSDHYYFNEKGYIVTDITRVPYPSAEILPGYGSDKEDAEVNIPGKEGNPNNYDYPDGESALFVFDENGVFQKDQCGVYDDNGVTRWISNGMVIWHAGLVKDGDDYRYFKRNGMVADVETYVAKTNGLLEAAKYTFGTDGKLMKLEGLYEDLNGNLCYYVNYIKSYAGLVKVDGDFYYIASDLKAVKDSTYYVTKTNDLKPAGYYAFDADGKMIIKNGLVEENGDLYYYEDGAKVANGLIEWNGNYYYIASNLKAVKDAKHYIFKDKANGLKPQGWYWFNANGMMFLDGFREENGTKYYYKDGLKNYAGLIKADGDYYYVKSDCSVVAGRSYYVTKTNGFIPAGTYEFDANGKLQEKNGIYREKLSNGNEYLFYYVDNVRQINSGLVQLSNGNYIYVRSGANLAVGSYYVSKTNNLLPKGTYTFGEDGIMIK